MEQEAADHEGSKNVMSILKGWGLEMHSKKWK